MTDKILEVRGLTKTYGGEKLKGDKKATPRWMSSRASTLTFTAAMWSA